jgi:hypothetical protein
LDPTQFLKTIFTLFAGWPVLVLMLIYYKRKILSNSWLILADKFNQTGRFLKTERIQTGLTHILIDNIEIG